MTRVTIGAPRRQKKIRYFKQAKGFRGGRSKLWRTVRENWNSFSVPLFITLPYRS